MERAGDRDRDRARLALLGERLWERRERDRERDRDLWGVE